MYNIMIKIFIDYTPFKVFNKILAIFPVLYSVSL